MKEKRDRENYIHGVVAGDKEIEEKKIVYYDVIP